jgi:hypothetical protein
MVPSNESSAANTNQTPNPTSQTSHGVESESVLPNSILNNIKDEEFRENLLRGFELHLQDMRLKALTIHNDRMIKVRALLAGSGMDNQQQMKVERELDRLFRPLFT